MFKKFTIVTTSLALLALAVVPLRADASGSCNNIQSGLWSGVNAALGTNYGCGSVAQPTQPAAQSSGIYVALGDSVAAGLGLPVASTGDEDCGVSAQAYPTAVSAATQLSYINAACSGATAGDLVSEQHLANTPKDIEPQLDTAFANGVPSLVTITAGANDIYWQYFADKCNRDVCGTTADETAVNVLLPIMQAKYEYAMNDIATRSNGQPPQVIMTGYYQPLSSQCSAQFTNLTAAEIAWLNSKVAQINQVVQQVASKYSFATYVPIDFAGHELCSSDPWIQGLTDNAPIHPTARGQQAMADAVVTNINRSVL